MKRIKRSLWTLTVIAPAVLVSHLFGAKAEAATIRADFNVNFREAGSVNSDRIGYLKTGQTASVLGLENQWFQVEIDGRQGYTHQRFWSLDSLTALEAASVRQAPDQLSPLRFSVSAGTPVKALGRSGEWILIEFNGHQGFSHWTYWDAGPFFDQLPEVEAPKWEPLADPADGEPGTNESGAVAGGQLMLQGMTVKEHKVILNEEMPGFASADNARTKTDPLGLQAKGTYLLRQIETDMYYLTPAEDEAPEEAAPEEQAPEKDGAANAAGEAPETGKQGTEPAGEADGETGEETGEGATGEVTAEGQASTGEPDEDTMEMPSGFWIDPAQLAETSGGRYAVFTPLPGHGDARSAAAGKDQAVTVSKGIYFIYRTFNGMLNVSTSETTPGAWIDPAQNRPEMDSAVPVGDQIVDLALGLLGAPYILGAESWEEGGFDCSGVTHFSYGQLGLELPRRASQQWAGINEKITEPRPGDIVAFEKDGEVYHVGIYIGNGKMIHAPKPGDHVKISDLGWWYKNSTVKGFLRPVVQTP